jgi:hypothetical protein
MAFDGLWRVRSGTLAVGVGVAATSVILAGCGASSDNGEAKKTGPQVASDAADAMKAAGAFHIAGTANEGGKPMSVDLQIQNNDLSGKLTLDGASFNLIVVNGKAYIKGDTKFWTASGVPAQSAALISNRWVLAPSSTSADFSQLTADGFAKEFKNPSDSAIQTTVRKAKVDGKNVVVVTQKDGSELDVAAKGKPYPVRISNKGESGALTFSGWGQTQPINTPPSPLDLNNISS